MRSTQSPRGLQQATCTFPKQEGAAKHPMLPRAPPPLDRPAPPTLANVGRTIAAGIAHTRARNRLTSRCCDDYVIMCDKKRPRVEVGAFGPGVAHTMSLIIASRNVVLPAHNEAQPATVHVDLASGKISRVHLQHSTPKADCPDCADADADADDVTFIDYGDLYILPGLVESVLAYSYSSSCSPYPQSPF